MTGVRVGVLYPDKNPLLPRHWSGTPHGVAQGLATLGADVVPVGTSLPLAVRAVAWGAARLTGRTGVAASRTELRHAAHNRALRHALARSPDLSLLIAMGTERFDLGSVRPRDVVTATYDDATLAQMARHADSEMNRASLPQRAVKRWIERQAGSSRSADLCFVSSHWAGASLVHDYGVPEEKVVVVGIGHRPRPAPQEGRDWSNPRFLFVGLDWIRKNGALVVDAFDEVRATIPTATCDLVGATPMDLERPGLCMHGVLDRENPADQATLDALYAQATAFVMPSLFEPAGIVYLEAASAGLPVITTTAGGASELLGEAACSVNPRVRSELVTEMLKLCDPGTAIARGTAAAKAAAEQTWPGVAQRMLQAVERLPDCSR